MYPLSGIIKGENFFLGGIAQTKEVGLELRNCTEVNNNEELLKIQPQTGRY